MSGNISKILYSVDPDEIKLDRAVKTILADKAVLSRIIKEVVDECKDMSYNEIEKCLESPAEVEKIPIEPGFSNLIYGMGQEDYIPNEGLIVYDIRTYLQIPSTGKIAVKILIDVEAQKDEHPGYDIATRAVFYCCRMISSQLDREFTVHTDDAEKYNGIKKVYSIWICPETSQKRANTITKYSICKEMLAGKPVDNGRYDLMTAVIINLSKSHKTDGCSNELVNMLTDLLDETQKATEKIRKLEQNHGIPVSDGLEKEVKEMLSYTRGIKERATAEGLAEGLAEGMTEGQNILIKAITMLREGYTDEDILNAGIDRNTLDLAKTVK